MQAVVTSTFKYANVDELNYGITQAELEVTEKVCQYLRSASPYESRRKTESQWAAIAGSEGECLNYAINVAKRFFAGVAYV